MGCFGLYEVKEVWEDCGYGGRFEFGRVCQVALNLQNNEKKVRGGDEGSRQLHSYAQVRVGLSKIR